MNTDCFLSHLLLARALFTIASSHLPIFQRGRDRAVLAKVMQH